MSTIVRTADRTFLQKQSRNIGKDQQTYCSLILHLLKSQLRKEGALSTCTSLSMIKIRYTGKPPNRPHPKQRIGFEWWKKLSVPNVTTFVNLPPNSGHLSMTDKFYKTRRCPLFRGFTVQAKRMYEQEMGSYYFTTSIRPW